jgi:predicted PurR-regulated permease PerM
MNVTATVCLVVIALAMVIFAVASIMVVSEIQRIRESLGEFILKLDREIIPLAAEIRQVAEDVRSVTGMTRYQLERINASINYASNNLLVVVDSIVRTINTVRHGILSPFNNIAAILKGVSRGVEYFFRSK